MLERQASLPPELYENTIENMEPGVSAWTVPWAMHVDEEGSLWLNGKYPVHKKPGGTVQMRVERTKEGWHVDITGCPDERWSPGASYVGGSNSVPVADLIGSK